MKTLNHIFALAMLLFSFTTEAQFLETVGKSAERAAKRTVLRKTEQKTSQTVGKAIDRAVHDDPAKKRERQKRKKERRAHQENNTPIIDDTEKFTGKWYYVSMTLRQLGDCQKKSHFIFSGNNYIHLLYGEDCTPISGSSGAFSVNRGQLILSEKGNTATYSVLSHTEDKLILKDEKDGHIIGLRKERFFGTHTSGNPNILY